jgi:hypothetical protein
LDTITPLNQARADYNDQLRNLHDRFVEKARALGRTSEKDTYTDLKEEMHKEYALLGNRLLEAGFYDFSLMVFSRLEQTVHECWEITGAIDFSKGLAFYNQGVAYIFQENFFRGISLIQLAQEADKDLAHHGAAEKALQSWSASACNFIRDLLNHDQDYRALEPATILDRLGNDRYRLMAIVVEYQTRLRDWRSLAVKDAAEANIMRICKLTEYYLKKRLRKAVELSPLIQSAFSHDKRRFPWYAKWAQWKNKGGATSYSSASDDAKIESILQSSDDGVLKSFKLLCLLRNFTAHIYNEESILFDRYEECFKACLGALMYTVNYVG